jgi:hypothetical protein
MGGFHFHYSLSFLMKPVNWPTYLSSSVSHANENEATPTTTNGIVDNVANGHSHISAMKQCTRRVRGNGVAMGPNDK